MSSLKIFGHQNANPFKGNKIFFPSLLKKSYNNSKQAGLKDDKILAESMPLNANVSKSGPVLINKPTSIKVTIEPTSETSSICQESTGQVNNKRQTCKACTQSNNCKNISGVLDGGVGSTINKCLNSSNLSNNESLQSIKKSLNNHLNLKDSKIINSINSNASTTILANEHNHLNAPNLANIHRESTCSDCNNPQGSNKHDNSIHGHPKTCECEKCELLLSQNNEDLNEPKATYSYLKSYFVSMLQPSDNKLAMKLFGSKKGVLKEKLRQQEVGHWIIHPCSNFRYRFIL